MNTDIVSLPKTSMGGGKEKEKKIKTKTQPTSSEKHAAPKNPNLWPDLPHQLIYLIARNPSSLMQDICSKGVTKSWRKEPIKCGSSTTPPWLELSTHDAHDHHNLAHTFNIAFRTGYSYWGRGYSPVLKGYHFFGCSRGLLLAKDISSSSPALCYKLWNPISDSWWNIPSWDERVPFLCVSLSSFPMIDLRKNKCIVVVLTGVTHPAFAYYRIWEGEDWVRKDSTIIDPHFSDPNERGRHLMRFTNGIWFEEKFYALSLQGTLAVIEEIDFDLKITSVSKKIAVPSVPSARFRECLIESEGKLLVVFLIYRHSISIVDHVEVYELNADNLTWIRKLSLGDKALFIGDNCCMSISANKVGCRGNCVYFSHCHVDGWWVFEIETGIISPHKSPVRVEPTMME